MKRRNNEAYTDLKSQIEEADFGRQAKSKSVETDDADASGSIDIEFVDNGTEKHHQKRHRKNKRRKKILTKKQKISRRLLIIILILLFLIIILIIAFCVIKSRGEYSLLDYSNINIEAPDEVDAVLSDNGKTVEYNGKTYTFNENITNILFLGIDQFDELGTEVYGTAGQADAIYLLAYDIESGDCTLISIPRDWMAEIDIYSTTGNYMGAKTEQLCLSYAYGDGQAASCENVITSVSKLFYGIPINSYFAIDISAITPLNDAIGDVTVTVLEDLPGMSVGETVTLKGSEAITYVRYRDTSVLDSNLNRIERQKQYISAFIEKLIPSVSADISVVLDLYNTVSSYMVTNLDTSRITYLATSFINGNTTGVNIESVEGETVKGELYAEFYADETALYELILDTFYTVEE